MYHEKGISAKWVNFRLDTNERFTISHLSASTGSSFIVGRLRLPRVLLYIQFSAYHSSDKPSLSTFSSSSKFTAAAASFKTSIVTVHGIHESLLHATET